MTALVKGFIEDTKASLTKATNDRNLLNRAINDCSRDIRRLKSVLKDIQKKSYRIRIENGIIILSGYLAQMKQLRSSGSSPSATGRDLVSSRVKWEDSQSAFKNRIRTGIIINLTHKEPATFLDDCNKLFKRRIQNTLKREMAVEANAVLCGEFKTVRADKELLDYKYMNTRNAAIYRDTDLQQWFKQNISDEIGKKLEEFQERDSGWALSSIINLMINLNKFTPLLGSSYIDLPGPIKRKEACINVKNNDNACFAWAIVSALHPAHDHQYRITKYPHYSNILNLTHIQFPMTIQQIPRFEKQNDNISVNVYILRKERNKFKTFPVYLTNSKKVHHINLLMIQNIYYDEDSEAEQGQNHEKDDKPVHFHYVWIKSFSRLLSSEVSHHKSKLYFCERCLHYFYTLVALRKHLEACLQQDNYNVLHKQLL